MLRVLHAADLHLGMENYGRLDPATGLSSRVADFLSALDETVQHALNNDIDLYLFCGDAYKTRDPSPTYQRELARRVHLLTSSGVAVFLLVGNHDLPNAVGRATTVEIFNTLSVPRVYVGHRPGIHRIETRRGVLQVVALPWLLRGALLTRDDYRNRTVDELNEILVNRIRVNLQQLETRLDPSLPAILAGHGTVTGARLGSECAATLGHDVVLPATILARPVFAYVAMGHLHRHQVLPTSPPIVYAGSLQRIDFGEEREEKGFVVVDIPQRSGAAGIRDGETSFTFVPVGARRFVTIEVDADVEDPTRAVLEAIAAHDIVGAVVRVLIRISAHRENLLKEGEIRRSLRQAFYVAAIAKQVTRETRTRLDGHSVEEMSPLQALELHLQTQNLPPERVRVLMDHARELLEESSSQ